MLDMTEILISEPPIRCLLWGLGESRRTHNLQQSLC